MSEQPYMQLWVADFCGDTLHLSAAEIGQYMLLLMAMWRNGGMLPADAKTIERIAREPISNQVMALFDRAGAFLTQKRLTAELEKARHKREARSQAGRRGNEVKSLKNKEAAIANGNAKLSHLPVPEPFSEAGRRANKTKPLKNKEATIANGNAKAPHLPVPESYKDNRGETPLSLLASVIDEERAKAVLQHRSKRKAPNTLRAIRLLVKNLSECPDANAAADEMLLRGWTAVKADWLRDKNSKVVTSFRPSGPKRTWAEIKAGKDRLIQG